MNSKGNGMSHIDFDYNIEKHFKTFHTEFGCTHSDSRLCHFNFWPTFWQNVNTLCDITAQHIMNDNNK